jgi:hypothetical protein
MQLQPIEKLLHPTEASRFQLALLASGGFLFLLFLLLAAGGGAALGTGLVFFTIVPASIWITLQIARARLMGRSLRVTHATYPEIVAELEHVCRLLDYRRPIEVYVTEKGDPPLSTTSYLGTRIILMEGDFVAGLLAAPERAQLRFLIGREIGALKARHHRLNGALALLAAANALQFVKPLVTPWYRATAHSGDQIGLAVCGSLDAALLATGRLLVGRELARRLPVGGVLPQAVAVRHGTLTRRAAAEHARCPRGAVPRPRLPELAARAACARARLRTSGLLAAAAARRGVRSAAGATCSSAAAAFRLPASRGPARAGWTSLAERQRGFLERRALGVPGARELERGEDRPRGGRAVQRDEVDTRRAAGEQLGALQRRV